jgi:hypothetical protein
MRAAHSKLRIFDSAQHNARAYSSLAAEAFIFPAMTNALIQLGATEKSSKGTLVPA